MAEQALDGAPERAGGLADHGHGVGDCFQCRSRSHRQLVGDTAPQQPHTAQCVIGALDLCSIAFRYRHPEILHILRGLAQGGAINAGENQAGAGTENL